MGEQRLQKFLASAGVASRRASEELIRKGRVTVNGVTAELGSKVDPDRDQVRVDGRLLEAEAKEYWLLNKPPGLVTTARDPQHRGTVLDLVPAVGRVFPVGRLDLDTSGVLLLTNDGDLANRLLHPRYGVDKLYEVEVEGTLSEAAIERLEQGVTLEDGKTAPAEVNVEKATPKGSRISMKIHEGRKRQVKRMLAAVGHPVLGLHRRRFGPLDDAGLQIGRSRRLNAVEIEALRRYAEDE